MRSRNKTSGFTLVELMMSVAIVGILSAISDPRHSKKRRRAQSAEATLNLRKMFEAAKSFSGGGDPTVRRGAAVAFPESQAATPAGSCCAYPGGKCPPNPTIWNTDTWNSLHFAVSDPHLFRYEFESTVTDGS